MAKKLKLKEELILDSKPTEYKITTADDLINIHNIPLEEWTVTKKLLNKWDIIKKDEEGKTQVVPMFQTKVTLEKNISKTFYNQLREEFIESIKKLSPNVKFKYNKLPEDGCLFEVNLFDFHFGKLSWHEETGFNFDTKIAKSLFEEALEGLMQKASKYKIDKILFPIGNDFFNSDYAHPYNKTTNGTPQEEDLRWQRTFREGRELLVQSINKLSTIAPVDVIIIPGNHDFEKSFYLGDSLEGWFSNNENININNSASPRKYYTYHKNLIGFSHGNNENMNDIPIIMPQECAKEWANVKYKEFHVGHLHHKKEIKYIDVNEKTGITIRYMSSITAADSWHHRNGYVGSQRSAEGYIWSKENGLEAHIFHNIYT